MVQKPLSSVMVCYDNAVKTCNIKLIKLNIYRPCVLDLLSIKRSFRVVLPPNNDSIIFFTKNQSLYPSGRME